MEYPIVDIDKVEEEALLQDIDGKNGDIVEQQIKLEEEYLELGMDVKTDECDGLQSDRVYSDSAVPKNFDLNVSN